MNINKKTFLNEASLDVLTVGELLIDFISEDYVTELKSAVHFQKTFGGSPGNIAVNLSGMGLKTAIIGSVGNDEFGEFIQEFLKTRNVNIEGLQKVEEATSMIFVTKSLESPHYFAVRNADYCLKDKDTNYQLIDQCKIFHFTAWALSMPQIRAVTMDLLQYARFQKKLITFDPNYRKNLWEINHDGAKWIQEYVLPLVDIIKPSEDDALNIWNIQGSMIEDVFMELSEKNEMTIILTKGAKGLTAYHSGKRINVPSYAKTVIDTTGAGDAFWAGFMASLLMKNDLHKALDHGSQIAAHKLEHVGAITDLPLPKEC
ncbi:carbohydrate kinase family protein [Tindallia californiensis]|uniref:Fructokinase n=1 Tax=Tindallia californiensis TaxID=159292 RepID=A0A1H3I628_9FIRM|nr:carbohydrate kinase [Tindallia californiensis]SDY23176.1 fructokinase [Tindallia californiensis]